MKRFLLVLLLVFLTGCSVERTPSTEPSGVPTEITEPSVPWVEAIGMEWDSSGAIQEIPLTIPDGLHYSAALEFDGDLLLWSVDSHREDAQFAELCLVELDDGSVTAQKDVPVSGFVTPRSIGDSLYLCDNYGGMIYRLNKSLQILAQWSVPTDNGYYYVGSNNYAYLLQTGEHLLRYNLSTGESYPVLPGNPYISWVNETEDSLIVKYYNIDNGEPSFAVVDIIGGEYFPVTLDVQADSVSRCGNIWLYEYYSMNQYTYYLETGSGKTIRFISADMNFKVLEEGYLLGSAMDGTSYHLYDLHGQLISSCSIFQNGNGYIGTDLIWNDAMDGFFFIARSYDESSRLLFWDIRKNRNGGDLTFEILPEPDENQLLLETRAEELEQKFGVSILVGEQCETQFDEFSATRVSDYHHVINALDILDQALSVYPNGLIHQLRFDYMRGIQIQLVSDLQADGSGRTGGGYSAFTQPKFDHHLIVVDIDDACVETYYHEFSHIIDNYLSWDSGQREDALYSEETWASLNPAWFGDYTYDYSQMHSLEDDTSFISGYATVSPTEDRAMVMEYAMASWGKAYFEEDTILWRKLKFYCRCIRDAFDTSGWTETLPWEQYL